MSAFFLNFPGKTTDSWIESNKVLEHLQLTGLKTYLEELFKKLDLLLHKWNEMYPEFLWEEDNNEHNEIVTSYSGPS